MYSLNVLYEGVLSCNDVQQKTKSEQRHPLPGGTSLARSAMAYVTWGRGLPLVTHTRVPCEPINRDGSPRSQERNQEEPKRGTAAGAARESFTGSLCPTPPPSPHHHSSFSISHVRRFIRETRFSDWLLINRCDQQILAIIIIVMRKVTGKHLLCFFLLSITLSWAEDTRKDVRKTENDTGEVFVWFCFLTHVYVYYYYYYYNYQWT